MSLQDCQNGSHRIACAGRSVVGVMVWSWGFQRADRDEAKAWIVRNQLGRRNLTLMQRAELALICEPEVRMEAKDKENQRKSKGEATLPNSGESLSTDRKLGVCPLTCFALEISFEIV